MYYDQVAGYFDLPPALIRDIIEIKSAAVIIMIIIIMIIIVVTIIIIPDFSIIIIIIIISLQMCILSSYDSIHW